MAKFEPQTITNLTNESSAVQAINENFETLSEVIDTLLSRTGASPNTMAASLDMNSNRILNVPAPVDDNDLVRLVDITEGIEGPEGPPGGPLADADYGDLIVSGSGTIWTIDPTLLPAYGRTLIANTTAADARTDLGLGTSATKDTGTSSTTVAAGDDSRFTRFTVTAKNATGNLELAENFLYHSSATPHTFTIQPVATIAQPTGVVIFIKNGASGGSITLARGAGVALYINGAVASADGTITAGGNVQLIQYAADTWLAQGSNIS